MIPDAPAQFNLSRFLESLTGLSRKALVDKLAHTAQQTYWYTRTVTTLTKDRDNWRKQAVACEQQSNENVQRIGKLALEIAQLRKATETLLAAINALGGLVRP
jgi:chromosome segregation ATPase